MPESLRTRLLRAWFNVFPAFWGTGGRVTYIAHDFSEVRLAIPLSWRTRNYVGTIFGGSMYGAVDPIFMLMLLWRLGRDYIVWDKAAAIRFRRPGRSTLTARFIVDDSELAAIRTALTHEESLDRLYTVELVDREGTVCAIVEKTIYVRRKDATPAPDSTSVQPGGPAT